MTRSQNVGGERASASPRKTRRQGRGGDGKSSEKGKKSVRSFRPLYRPPMLLICLLDDDGADGEWIRVRDDRFVIGRSEGDYCVPHESGMSSQHIEISRAVEDGEPCWYVRDMDTTNGTFVLVDSARLRNRQQILLGRHRYRFDSAPQGSGSVAAEESSTGKGSTQAWHVIASAETRPSLVRLSAEGDAEEYPFQADEQWIGTDGQQCRIAVPDDAFLDPRHAKIFMDARDKWRIEDGGSTNGTWVSAKKVKVETSAKLQVGEQRFELKVP